MADIIGTSGADILNGTADNDRIDGQGGDDTISGLGGDDTIVTNAGNTNIAGGDGHDSIMHRFFGSSILNGGAGDDFIRLDHGTTFLNNHNGNGSATAQISGGEGRDRVEFSTQWDGTATIDLGSGDDLARIYSGYQAITVTLGDGRDRLRFGNFYSDYNPIVVTDFTAGDSGDILDIVGFGFGSGSEPSNPFATGRLQIVQDGSNVAVQYDPDGTAGPNSAFTFLVLQNTTLASLTAANFGNVSPGGAALTAINSTGTGGDDMLFGSALADTLSGGIGNDTLDGGPGNDTLSGGSGRDFISAGGGSDTVHGGDGDDVIDDAGDSDAAFAIYGEGGNDTITVTGFNATGTVDSGDGDDTIDMVVSGFQTPRADTILAGAGNDWVHYIGQTQGTPGSASIDLGTGNDTLKIWITDFSPQIILGAGIDTVILEQRSNPYVVDILDFATGNSGDVFDFKAYVAANGSGLPTDGNPFTGGLWARLVQDGADVVLYWDRFGQGFNYQPVARFRNTTVGAFTDQNFGFALNPPVPDGVNLTAPAGGGTLSGTRWNDTLNGLDGPDTIFGLSGNDIINGSGGADTLHGGVGNDQIFGGSGDDHIVNGLEGVADTDTIDAGAGNDRIVIYHSLGSALGGDGDDLFEVRGPSGAINGGAGTDTIQFFGLSSQTTGLQLSLTNLWSGGIGTIGPANSPIQSIEVITGLSGTQGNDYFVFGTGYTGIPINQIDMNGGNDFVDTGDVVFNVNGGSGNDHLIGGTIDNGLRGDDGDDLIEGGGGNDNLNGDNGNDHLIGGEGNDSLFGFNGADLLEGGNGADSLYGVDGDDTLIGGAGNDLLAIGAGTDNAQGGDGDDTFQIQPGWLFTGDVIDGGAGTDRMQIFELAGLSFNLTGYWAGLSGTVGGATVSGIETFEFTLGDAADHIVIGADATNGQTIDGKGGNDILVGGGGADTLIGGNGNDQLDGGSGDDTIDGGFGDDLLLFNIGNDRFDGGFDFDTLQAAADGAVLRLRVSGPGLGGLTSFNLVTGIEAISGGGFANVVLTGSDTHDGMDFVGIALSGISAIQGLGGHDQIIGSSIADRIEGGEGNDILSGALGDDVLDGGAGDDQLNGGEGIDLFFGGLGNDTFQIDNQAELIFENAGEGTDTVIAFASAYLFQNIENLTLVNGSGAVFGVGNALANTMTGNAAANLLLGGGGDDTVHGGDGGDSLFGESGADTLNGDGGIDYIAAGAGNDVIFGGDQADALYGEDGDDYLNGGISFDTDILVGGAGNDTLFGSSGLAEYDLMDGGAGNDTYYVDTGADLTFEAVGGGTDTVHANVPVPNAGVYLYANVENLILEGNTAFGVGNELNNSLIGSNTPNWLLGGAGNDRIDGRGSDDVLFGQAGADTFVFNSSSGADLIGDFALAEDKIEFAGIFTSFAQVQANMVQVGANMAIDLGNGSLVVLMGVNKAQLTAANFIFVSAAEAPKGTPAMEPPSAKPGSLEPLAFHDAGQDFWQNEFHHQALIA